MWQYNYSDNLYHHGVKGMKWGVRKNRRRNSRGRQIRRFLNDPRVKRGAGIVGAVLAGGLGIAGVMALQATPAGAAALTAGIAAADRMMDRAIDIGRLYTTTSSISKDIERRNSQKGRSSRKRR